ncbi:cilia- and flagella-associated protein 251-like [Zingiber officinale]|uniref:cilia- and flagella-associated protein 251-like n=1 Tax=Zingiber officinale TaxID=94328 RepID=UPI001C4CF4C6|nr:cilia- and flagella-associated protein 251-like [Zingiber officinale]
METRVEGFAAVGAENIDALEGVDVAALVNPKEGWDTADVGVAKEKPVAKVDVVVTGEDEVVLPDDTTSNELRAKELPLPKEKGEVEMLVMAGEEVAVAEEENRGDAEEEAGNGDTKDGAGADVVGTEKAGGDEDVANEGTEGAEGKQKDRLRGKETGVVEAEDGADGEKRLEVVEAEDGADGGKRLKVEAAEDGADVEKRLEVEKAEDAADEEPKVERPKRDGEEPAEEEAPREKPVAEDEAAPAAVGAKEKGEAEEREKEEEEEETEDIQVLD